MMTLKTLLRFKQDFWKDVKVTLLILVITSLCSVTFAEEPQEERLPDIRAEVFDVIVVKRSNSNRIYLFDDTSDHRPPPGKVLLLKKDNDPIMAFLVLKNYMDRKQFAAKRIRKYGDYQLLENSSSYLAIEKIGDIDEVPTQTQEDKADIKELEPPSDDSPPPTAIDPTEEQSPEQTSQNDSEEKIPEIAAYDPELDAGTSPPPPSLDIAQKAEEEDPLGEQGDDEAETDAVSINEVTSLDPYSHWITGGGGYFKNGTAAGRSPYYTGGGIRYGLTVGRMILLRTSSIQDSLAIEGGAFFYKILGFWGTSRPTTTTQGVVASAATDAYTVMPLSATLRYNVLLSEDFSVFFYGGVTQNLVLAAIDPDLDSKAAATRALSTTLPAVGGGLLFRVGPHWHARIDVGMDSIGGGVLLRF